MNKEYIIDRLKRKRDMLQTSGEEEVIESLIKEYERIELYVIYSRQANISVINYENQSVIIWDQCYWKYYKKYLEAIETTRKVENSITQAGIAVMTEYLSERYEKARDVSMFLRQIPEQYGISVNLNTDDRAKIETRISIAKIFSFYHEIAHIKIQQEDKAALDTKTIVLEMMSGIKREHFNKLGKWADLHYKMKTEIMEGRQPHKLHELMADVYAAGKLALFLDDNFQESDFWKAYIGCIGIGYISGFQNLFNVISKVWEDYYVDMRFGIQSHSHEINPEINELEVLRSGLGVFLIVTVLLKHFNLDNFEEKMIWKCYDEEHIDNTGTIECLTDSEFICTLIKEGTKDNIS